MDKNFEVLYIDDEYNNLVGFKAALRFHYNIHIASNTTDAENILMTHPNIRVIFCDQKMPGENGIDFFSRIKKEYPRPIRILITAFADMETVIDSINRGHIFRFIKKPWEEAEIISCIEEANKFYVTNSLLDIRNMELQKAYEELDKFAYSVSHDLRDPLAGVLGAIRIALDFKSVEQVHEILNLMKASVVKLEDYINSLRDYYLLRRGELNLSKIDFNVIFEDILDFYKVYTQSSGVEISYEVNQENTFINDKSILELILHNLVSNAIKYQKNETVEKKVKLSANTENGQVIITVSDNGIGISESSINDIFRLFFRASDQAEGMGFGLYNVKTAIQKLKGEIVVESKPDEGSKFIVTIPSKE
ncbi:hybrid sensor histidine kinase/response regulator [Sphingobacterium cellulitidis]|uniref:hybrid sensor histidine kinase/response regulator n=1 Tax=Sphingobacterium cellulitidis TaxID=1768011 RepID=UPI000B940A97|nr:hybrid sensor histidine kinase/response regulator [Sphingobacterium cellulitidis]OYD45392.1 hybrid sensor histidine kinase/response regulator [Sphingobacterium cellulitidis]